MFVSATRMPHIAEMSQELDRLEPHLPLLLEHLPVPSSPLHCTALRCAVLLNCASGWRTYHYRAGTVCVWCGQDLIIGSTNWTVASKANSELSVQLEVGPEDHAEVAGAFWLAVVRSHAYDEAYTAATYRRRAEEAKLNRDSQSSASGSEGSLWIERTGEIVGDKLVLYEQGERKTEEKASRRWLNPRGLAYAHWRKEAGV